MARYSKIPILKKSNEYKTIRGKRYYGTAKYPDIPLSYEDTYVYAEEGDRFDQLAQQYYNNSSYWWIISIANDSLRQDSYYVPLNQQIRIPQEIGPILSAFNKLNNVY